LLATGFYPLQLIGAIAAGIAMIQVLHFFGAGWSANE
jgi:hypothetical protein